MKSLALPGAASTTGPTDPTSLPHPPSGDGQKPHMPPPGAPAPELGSVGVHPQASSWSSLLSLSPSLRDGPTSGALVPTGLEGTTPLSANKNSNSTSPTVPGMVSPVPGGGAQLPGQGPVPGSETRDESSSSSDSCVVVGLEVPLERPALEDGAPAGQPLVFAQLWAGACGGAGTPPLRRRRRTLQVRRENEGVGSLAEGPGVGQREGKGGEDEVEGEGTKCKADTARVDMRKVDLEKAPCADWEPQGADASPGEDVREGAGLAAELRGRPGKKLRLGSEEIPATAFQPLPCEQRVRFEELKRRSCLRGCGDVLEDGLSSMPPAVLRSILEGHYRKPPTASWLSL